MPRWLVTLLLAEEWGQMPEDVEVRVSAQWVDRWLALNEARGKAQTKQSEGSGRNLLDG